MPDFIRRFGELNADGEYELSSERQSIITSLLSAGCVHLHYPRITHSFLAQDFLRRARAGLYRGPLWAQALHRLLVHHIHYRDCHSDRDGNLHRADQRRPLHCWPRRGRHVCHRTALQRRDGTQSDARRSARHVPAAGHHGVRCAVVSPQPEECSCFVQDLHQLRYRPGYPQHWKQRELEDTSWSADAMGPHPHLRHVLPSRKVRRPIFLRIYPHLTHSLALATSSVPAAQTKPAASSP